MIYSDIYMLIPRECTVEWVYHGSLIDYYFAELLSWNKLKYTSNYIQFIGGWNIIKEFIIFCARILLSVYTPLTLNYVL